MNIQTLVDRATNLNMALTHLTRDVVNIVERFTVLQGEAAQLQGALEEINRLALERAKPAQTELPAQPDRYRPRLTTGSTDPIPDGPTPMSRRAEAEAVSAAPASHLAQPTPLAPKTEMLSAAEAITAAEEMIGRAAETRTGRPALSNEEHAHRMSEAIRSFKGPRSIFVKYLSPAVLIGGRGALHPESCAALERWDQDIWMNNPEKTASWPSGLYQSQTTAGQAFNLHLVTKNFRVFVLSLPQTGGDVYVLNRANNKAVPIKIEELSLTELTKIDMELEEYFQDLTFKR